MATRAAFTLQCAHGVTIVRLLEEVLGSENADSVFGPISAELERSHPEFVIINMRKVKYLHSAALAPLVGLRRIVLGYGGELRLCSLQPQALETLQITRIDRLLIICESEQSAMGE